MNQEPEEILNLSYNRRRLIIIALNKYGGKNEEAAKALGVCVRSLFNWCSTYKIEFDPKTKLYFSESKN